MPLHSAHRPRSFVQHTHTHTHNHTMPPLISCTPLPLLPPAVPFVAQMGIGRTTTGMVVASLVHMYHLQALARVR